MIKHDEMVRALAKPATDIIRELNPETMHNLHMAIGVCGEVGELFESIRDGDDNILKELGDIEFYFKGLQQGINFDIDDDDYKGDDLEGLGLNPLMEELTINACNILDTIKKQAINLIKIDRRELLILMWDFRAVLNAVYEHEEIGTTPYMAKCANIQKLHERYENFEYSNEAAQNRVDKIS